tara:strand:+ start:8527 stop:8832 length:306 start_codon:yes stop_codon:yes gene_type:complete
MLKETIFEIIEKGEEAPNKWKLKETSPRTQEYTYSDLLMAIIGASDEIATSKEEIKKLEEFIIEQEKHKTILEEKRDAIESQFNIEKEMLKFNTKKVEEKN